MTQPTHSPVPPQLDPSLLIGVPFIDREHRELVMHLDSLVKDRVPLQSAHLLEVFSLLGELLYKHFKHEEDFFRSCGMPGDDVVAHIQAHHKIIEQYAQINTALMKNKAPAMAEIAELIKQWIVDHMLEHDIKIRPYVVTQATGSPYCLPGSR